jgi:hypothetical protein
VGGSPLEGGAGTIGVMGRLGRESMGSGDGRGRKDSNGAGGLVEGERGGGCVGGGGCEARGLGASLAVDVRARLYSRQQVGHRHSTTRVPSGLL